MRRSSALGAALVLFSAACGAPGGAVQTASPPSTPTVTLTDEGCSYTGPGSLSSVRSSIAAVNAGSRPGEFYLLRLREPDDPEISATGTWEELVAFMASEAARAEAGQLGAPMPSFLEILGVAELEPGAEGELTATEGRPGIWGVACFPVGDDDMLTTAYLAGPLAVTD